VVSQIAKSYLFPAHRFIQDFDGPVDPGALWDRLRGDVSIKIRIFIAALTWKYTFPAYVWSLPRARRMILVDFWERSLKMELLANVI
jgi:hypothetical protein